MLRKLLPCTAALLLLVSLSLQAQTVPSPQQTDQIISDPNSNGKADPGDKIRYKVTIQNTGGSTATGTTLNAVPDAKTTFVPGSFRSSPLAMPDAYACTGNVGITVPAANGLKANDFDDNIAGLTVTVATNAATAQGGLVTIAADGSFTYTPPAGFTGSDNFSYTLNDGNAVAGVTATDASTATITISNMIWFVDNSVVGPGTGTVSDPFKALISAATASSTGQVIFVKHTGTNYTGGIALKNTQYLFGTAHAGGSNLADASVLPFTVAANSLALPAINGSSPAIENAAGNGVTLASDNTVRGVTIHDVTGAKIAGTNFGNLTIGNLIMTGSGAALNLTNGNFASATISSLTSTSSVTAIKMNNVTGILNALGSGSPGISGATGPAIEIIGGSVSMTYNPGIAQANNAALLSVSGGHTGTLTFQSFSLSATNGTGMVFDNADGTYNINVNTTLNGGAAAVSITNGSDGNFSFSAGVSITNPSGAAFLVSGGSGTVNYAGSISKNNAGRLVDIQSRSGGSVTLTGNLSSTGTSTGINVSTCTGGTVTFSGGTKTINTGANAAVTLAMNTGATINFTSGGLAITTTSGTGFNATDGGTVTVQGTGNTINSGSGTALNVVNTTIGGSGLTFRSIAHNGGTNGIVLNTTGSGGLTVSGDGGGSNNGSGGTIQNCTGAGVSLSSTSSVSLNYMNIQNGGSDGVVGASVNNFSMNRSTVTNNGDALDESGLDFGIVVPATQGLTGTSTLTNCSITSNYSNQVQVFNNSGTLTMTVTSCTINGRAAENNNNDGMLIQPNGTATINVSVTSSSFAANKGDHFQGAAANSGNLDIDFKNNTLTGGHSTALGQGITISAATGVMFGGYSGAVTYDVDNNNFNGAISNSISVVQGTSSAAATFNGFVRNNIIGTSGVALSGSTQANGVYIDSRGNGTHTSSVTGNTIRQCYDRGILLEAGDGDPVAHLTITGNTIDQQVHPDSREAIQTNFGITTTNVFGNIDSPVICLQLGGAGALANTFSHGAGAPDDFRLRKRHEATVRLPGYAGGTGQTMTDLDQVVAFIRAQNTGSAGEPGSAAASGAGGGYTGGAACNTPN